MSLREFLLGKKLIEREKTIAYLLREVAWIPELEKRYLRLEKQVRKGQADRNRLAARITALERKKKA
ncbi:hypothetical protein ES705_09372 [subsurface metagenome]